MIEPVVYVVTFTLADVCDVIAVVLPTLVILLLVNVDETIPDVAVVMDG